MEDGIFFFMRQLFISNVKKSILGVKNLLHQVGLFIKCKYSSLNKSINLAYYYCHLASILATPVRYGPSNPTPLLSHCFYWNRTIPWRSEVQILSPQPNSLKSMGYQYDSILFYKILFYCRELYLFSFFLI